MATKSVDVETESKTESESGAGGIGCCKVGFGSDACADDGYTTDFDSFTCRVLIYSWSLVLLSNCFCNAYRHIPLRALELFGPPPFALSSPACLV